MSDRTLTNLLYKTVRLNLFSFSARDISGTKCDFTVQVQLRYVFVWPVLSTVIFFFLNYFYYFPFKEKYRGKQRTVYGEVSHPAVFVNKDCCWLLWEGQA